ncbi:hypothetical protein [Paracoccus sanguinis]|uniref:hypothetical protein n=1 Tax=Paracoccus sanguinis TaxID=1545044 RepID=UPI0012E02351|nr:hypothetical protein [Paracoccus sanguinis]
MTYIHDQPEPCDAALGLVCPEMIGLTLRPTCAEPSMITLGPRSPTMQKQQPDGYRALWAVSRLSLRPA